jgi:hypothetical protein
MESTCRFGESGQVEYCIVCRLYHTSIWEFGMYAIWCWVSSVPRLMFAPESAITFTDSRQGGYDSTILLTICGELGCVIPTLRYLPLLHRILNLTSYSGCHPFCPPWLQHCCGRLSSSGNLFWNVCTFHATSSMPKGQSSRFCDVFYVPVKKKSFHLRYCSNLCDISKFSPDVVSGSVYQLESPTKTNHYTHTLA